MTAATEPTLVTLTGQLEEIWSHLDRVLDSLTPVDWQRKHGKDWIFADLPYHLSYFDRDIVAEPIRIGADLPADQQKIMRTMSELDAWNGRKFAERRSGQTVAESLVQMRAGRDAVREAVAGLTDADLDRRVFVPLVGCGWVTVRLALQSCLIHTWSHFTEARLRLKQAAPIPSPAITHAALSFFLSMMPMMVSRDNLPTRPFTAVMSVGGAGGGDWIIRVADGACRVAEGRAGTADLTMTYRDGDTFLAIAKNVQNPMLAMLTGKLRVQGFRNMGTFGKLFAEPKPDQVLEPLFVS
jgi:hypothetical protein